MSPGIASSPRATVWNVPASRGAIDVSVHVRQSGRGTSGGQPLKSPTTV
jgi:hypothetical protein